MMRKGVSIPMSLLLSGCVTTAVAPSVMTVTLPDGTSAWAVTRCNDPSQDEQCRQAAARQCGEAAVVVLHAQDIVIDARSKNGAVQPIRRPGQNAWTWTFRCGIPI